MTILKFFLCAAALALISANVMSQGHFVDPLTGSLNAEVPLFTLSDGDVQLPIALNYRTNGVAVNSASGLYGHGWNSTADAAISRNVRSLPDDYLGQSPDVRKGWLHGDMGVRIKNFTINTDNNESTCSDEVANYTFLNAFGYHEDTEPDVFYVNAPGLSFQFYFDENYAPQVVPFTDVQITYTTDPANSQISSFTVVDSKGYSYVFAALETTTEWAKDAYDLKDYVLRRKYELYSTACTYATSWKLSQIKSPVYGEINYSYRDVTLRSDPTYTISQGISVSLTRVEDRYNFKSNESLTTFNEHEKKIFDYDLVYNQKVVDSISSHTHYVKFTPHINLDNSEVIENIRIYDSRPASPVLLKEYALTYIGPEYFEYTGHTMPVPWDPGNIMVGSRSFLTSVQEKAITSMPPITMEYYGVDLPPASTEQKDDWEFFRSPSKSHWESVVTGSLKRVKYAGGGYAVVFYEPHDYFDSATGTTKRGGGIRVRKTIVHDGLSSSADIAEEYRYLNTNGQSSGRLAYEPRFEISTVRLNEPSYNDYYREVQLSVSAGTMTGPAGKYFKFTSTHGPGTYESVQGSVVAYQRVVKSLSGAGRSIYDYELPAMAGELTASNGEWVASTTQIARPSTGGSGCYEIGEIPIGPNTYPYPRNPNYSFARGLLTKITDENESGTKVHEVSFTYQRVYGGSAIRKLYGLTLDELPTSYYDGSTYTDGKMFLYGKYEILTDVKVELDEKKEIFYYSADLTKKSESTTSYVFDSPNHREITKVTTTNSDLTQSVTKLSYVRDYVITSAPETNASNIVKLKDAHRNEVIESLSSVISAGSEKYTSGTIFLFQEINTKVYPYQVLTFNSTDGLSAFAPSGITGGTTFHFDDSNYDLKTTVNSFSSTALPTEVVGKDRVVQSTVLGFGETLPVMQVRNAGLSEIGYSDFEGSNEVDFSGWGTAAKVSGRTGQTAITMEGSHTLAISRTILNAAAQNYVFSCWMKAAGAGNLTLQLKNETGDLITPIQIPYTGTGQWKLVTATVFTGGLPSSLTARLTSSAIIELDDVAIYPSHAQVAFSSYTLPFGVGSTTNMSGRSLFYSYDEWGRVTTVRDQDLNILNKRDYHVRP